MTGGILVIGYGNALRTDDGIGWHVAERLAGHLDDDPRLAGTTVLRRHQLTPELALDVSQAAAVVLIDARDGAAAGSITVERVAPAPSGDSTWSHHLSPASLVALAMELYGKAPHVTLVGVGVAELEMGDRLSPALEAALPRVVDRVAPLVAAAAGRPLPVATREASSATRP